MVQEIYAIRDEVGGFFELPFTAPNTRSAERMLQDYSVLEPASAVVLHSTDYTLYRLGQYDRDTGVIVPCTHPQLCCILLIFLFTIWGCIIALLVLLFLVLIQSSSIVSLPM